MTQQTIEMTIAPNTAVQKPCTRKPMSSRSHTQLVSHSISALTMK